MGESRQVFSAEISPIRMRIDMRVCHGNAIGEIGAGHPRGRLQFFFRLPVRLRPHDRQGGRVERSKLCCGVGETSLRLGHGRCLSPRCRSCFIRCALGHSSSTTDKFTPVRSAFALPRGGSIARSLFPLPFSLSISLRLSLSLSVFLFLPSLKILNHTSLFVDKNRNEGSLIRYADFRLAMMSAKSATYLAYKRARVCLQRTDSIRRIQRLGLLVLERDSVYVRFGD